MNEILKQLKYQIKECEQEKQGLDSASWRHEEGVLFSANHAKKIVDALETYTAPGKVPCGYCPGAFLNGDMVFCPQCGRRIKRSE